MKPVKPLVLLLFTFYVGLSRVNAQESVETAIDLQTAENIFIKNNLDLLSAKYQVSVNKAQEITASLWPNPHFDIGQNIYNPETQKRFDTSPTGNTDWQFSQLFKIGGKIDKQMRVAEFGTRAAEFQYYDILRNLRYILRTKFFELYWQRKTVKFYDNFILSLSKVVSSTEIAYSKGSLLLSDVLRLKSIMVSAQNDRLELINASLQNESDLKSLLWGSPQEGLNLVPVVDEARLDTLKILDGYQAAVDLAIKSRPDLKALDASLQQDKMSLTLEKARAIPDISLGINYSRAGSYIKEYYALTLGFDIPLFDRNQGAIQEANARIEMRRAEQMKTLTSLRNDLDSSYKKAIEADKALSGFDSSFSTQYNSLVDKMIHNYQQKNITIIIFSDFFESYKNSMVQYESLKRRRVTAYEELNWLTGAAFIK